MPQSLGCDVLLTLRATLHEQHPLISSRPRCGWLRHVASLQVDAQKAETRAATETLVEAEQEMEAIHFEKRQLTAQWRSSLLAISRREEALAAIKEAIHKQEEQERSIVSELARFKKDIQAQQVRTRAPTHVQGTVTRQSQFSVCAFHRSLYA